jgi:lambda repressor-like predicted transcriptional regulator
MKHRSKTNDTPAIDALQIKIELLKKGQSIREWSRRNGFSSPTVVRAMYGHPSSGPTINRARAMLLQLLNHTTGKGQQ